MGVPSVPPSAPPSRRGAVIVGGIVCAVLLLVVVVILGYLFGAEDPSTTSADGVALAGPDVGHPDPAPLINKGGRAGIPVLDASGAATHTHTLLRMKVNGKPVVIPGGIGIDMASGQIAAVHTHQPNDIIHVESPHVGDRYKLAQFLTLWGVGSDEKSLCQHFLGGPCRVKVSVVDPTAEDYAMFDGFGPMPAHATAPANGLDTMLDQGAVIEVDLSNAST
jgi:hypothetical protein